MFKTKNNLPEPVRTKAIEGLNARLADCIDLQTQTKQAHWNVKGPSLIALHEFFDKTALGKSARRAIEQANELGDLDTANLFTEISRGIEKSPRFVEAHQESERSDGTCNSRSQGAGEGVSPEREFRAQKR